MSWTDSDTVKKHLCAAEIPSAEHRDVAVQINASGTSQLPHRGLVENSEKVKRPAGISPEGPEVIILNGVNWAQLANADLTPGQAVAAADILISEVYAESVDYAIDWQAGKVRRLAGSAITDGGTVQVWYQRYEVLTKGVDYNIDYAEGQITMAAGGPDLANTTLYMDYALSAYDGASGLLDQAIEHAEDKILARLKEGYDANSTDQGLITGATELALSIVCRGLASRALLDGAPSAEGRARGWLQLAKDYETTAYITLRPFLANPLLVSGSKSGNASWEWV